MDNALLALGLAHCLPLSGAMTWVRVVIAYARPLATRATLKQSPNLTMETRHA